MNSKLKYAVFYLNDKPGGWQFNCTEDTCTAAKARAESLTAQDPHVRHVKVVQILEEGERAVPCPVRWY